MSAQSSEALEALERVLAKERQAMYTITAAVEELREVARGPDAHLHVELLVRLLEELSELRRAQAARVAEAASVAMAHVRGGLATAPAGERGGLVEAHEQLRDHRRRLLEHARPRVTARGRRRATPRRASRRVVRPRERRCSASSRTSGADPGGGDGPSSSRPGPAPRPRAMCGEAGP